MNDGVPSECAVHLKSTSWVAYLVEVFLGHLSQYFIEVALILMVNESIMEDSQCFMVEQASYLRCVSYHTYVCLH